MNPIAIIKPVAAIVGSLSAGTVVTTACKAITPTNAGLFTKAAHGIGGFVIAGMVSKSAVSYINDEVDEAVDLLNSFVQNREDN